MKNVLFKNTHKLGEKEYMTYMTGGRLVNYWKNDGIKYIPEIQRGLKTVINENGEKEEVAVFSAANVKKIKESMKKNSFYVSQITLNILENGSKLMYDENKKELVVVEGVLALLDGQHRVRALEELQDENPEFDLNKIIFPVKITNYPEEKAQEQFYQYTLGSKISSSRGEYFNNKDYANKIVKNLYNNSILTDRIENVKNIIGKNEQIKIVSFATLKNAIEINFNTSKMDNSGEANEVYEYLKEFFVELFDIIPEFNDYESRKLLKEEQSLKCENFTFYGYLAIAEYLQYKKDWKELLPYITEIDFLKLSPIWAGQVTKKSVIKRKSKNQEQEIKYTIINNTQSRKEMGITMVKAFKKVLRKNGLLD